VTARGIEIEVGILPALPANLFRAPAASHRERLPIAVLGIVAALTDETQESIAVFAEGFHRVAHFFERTAVAEQAPAPPALSAVPYHMRAARFRAAPQIKVPLAGRISRAADVPHKRIELRQRALVVGALRASCTRRR